MATRLQGATINHQTCHEYALTQCPTAEGTYQYILVGFAFSAIFGESLDEDVHDRENLDAGDILNDGLHSSSGVSTKMIDCLEVPAVLKWKWLDSGIYQFSTPSDYEWDTPMKTGAVDVSKTLPNQGWTLTYYSDPTIYR